MVMDNYIICIPTYDRVDMLGDKTLRFLNDCSISRNKIFIYVVEEEFDIYKTKYNEYNIIIGLKGKLEQTNFILEDKKDNNIVFMDDDVDYLLDTHGVVLEIDDLIIKGFSECNKHNTKLWGIHPCDNSYFLKNNISTTIKFIVGCFYGVINDNLLTDKMTWVHSQGDDLARSLHYYSIYKKVIRFNNIGIKTKYNTNKGGFQSIYSKEQRKIEQETRCKELELLYPKYCKRYYRKDGSCNLRFHLYKC